MISKHIYVTEYIYKNILCSIRSIYFVKRTVFHSAVAEAAAVAAST